MKIIFWKKTAAELLALLIVAGVSPVAPFSKTFERSAVTALGEVVASGYCGKDTNEGNEESVSRTLTKNNEDDENPTYALTISGTDAMVNYDPFMTPEAPWDSFKGSVASVVIVDGVTSIGHFDFYKFTNLTSLSFADTVTSICDSAFAQCSSLANIMILAIVTIIERGVFDLDTNLTSLIYGGSARSC